MAPHAAPDPASVVAPMSAASAGRTTRRAASAQRRRGGSGLDEAAFEAFYGATARELWRYLYRVLGDPAIAEDVLQESYLRLLRRPSRSDDERQQRAYLYRIASNLLRDRWRRARRERGYLAELLGRGEGAPAVRSAVQVQHDVQTVLAQLKPRERSLLWLAYVDGYRHDEIAAILDLRPASIRVMLHRARKRLSGILARHGYPSADPNEVLT